MTAEIDFSKGARGLHHIPPRAKVFLPVSIERRVWEYYARTAKQNGIELSELVTETLKREIDVDGAPR